MGDLIRLRERRLRPIVADLENRIILMADLSLAENPNAMSREDLIRVGRRTLDDHLQTVCRERTHQWVRFDQALVTETLNLALQAMAATLANAADTTPPLDAAEDVRTPTTAVRRRPGQR